MSAKHTKEEVMTKETQKHKVIPAELKKEMAEIFAVIREIPEARDFGVRLISTLKSEFEGRGAPPEGKLDKLRKGFDAMVAAFGE